MSTVTKFDIEKFDGKISFSIWQIQMRAVLIQNGLKKALVGISEKPAGMTDEKWEELDEKAHSAIQLYFSKEILREVNKEKTAAGLWTKLESLYMTKSLANKLRLKERLYTLRMAEGSQHKEKFTVVDHEKRLKGVEVIEGGNLEKGLDLFRVRFEVIEKQSQGGGEEDSCITKVTVEYEAKDLAAANLAVASFQVFPTIMKTAADLLTKNKKN